MQLSAQPQKEGTTLRLFLYLLRLFRCKRKVFNIHFLPVGYELSDFDRSALYGEEVRA